MNVEMTKEHINAMTDAEFEAYMNRDADDMDFDEIRKHWENTGKKKKETKVHVIMFLCPFGCVSASVTLCIWTRMVWDSVLKFNIWNKHEK